MAGGNSMNQQAAAAQNLSGSLVGLEANALAVAAAVGTLKTALHALSVSWAMKEIELTAQAFYRLRLSLGVSAQGAREYVKEVTAMTKANVTNRRALVGMFEEMRKSHGLVGVTNQQLAEYTSRLQKEFPQSVGKATQALAQMANESVYFHTMMSKSTDATTAFSMANAKWGSEYAQILMAARGETGKFHDANRNLLTLMAETKASVENASQSMSEAFKVPTLGVLGMVKGFADLLDIIGRFGDGQVGKMLGPLAAAGVMYGSMKMGQKFTSGLTQTRDAMMKGVPTNLGTAMPMRVVVTNPVLRVTDVGGVGSIEGATDSYSYVGPIGGKAASPTGSIAGQSKWQKAKALPGRAWKGMGGLQGAAGLMMGTTMVVGQYQSTRQGEEFGWGSALGSAGAGAFAGGMVGGPVGVLVGAMAGLTAAIIANTLAVSENIEEASERAKERMDQRTGAALDKSLLQEALDAAGPTPAGQRAALRKYAEEGIVSAREAEKYTAQRIEVNDAMIKELAELNDKMGTREAFDNPDGLSAWDTKWSIKDSMTKRMEELGVDVETAGGFNFLPGGLQDMIGQRILELEENSAKFEEKRAENQQKIKQFQELILNLSREDLRLAQSRVAIAGSIIQTEMKRFTYGAGPRSLGGIQQDILDRAAGQREAILFQQGVVLSDLAKGGADVAGNALDNRDVMGRLKAGQAGDFLRLLGSGTDKRFMEEAGKFFDGGATQQELAAILQSYVSQKELVGEINNIEQMRVDSINTEMEGRTLLVNSASFLLDLEQQRLDTQIQISSALKQPLIMQAKFAEEQIRTTQKQIATEEEHLAILQQGFREGKVSEDQLKSKTQEIHNLYGQLASQVDYIRRSWEEVFTMQSMNLSSGSYILPTMTGLMEKGPSFAPYSPTKMAGGRLSGQGTYESIMGFGKASAFGQLQEHLAKGMDSAAGSHIDAAGRLSDAATLLENAAIALGGSPAD